MHLASPVRIMSVPGSLLLRFKNNRELRSSTHSLGINNGIHLQPLAFDANLIGETNLFGTAVHAVELKLLSWEHKPGLSMSSNHSFIKEQIVKHH